MTMTTQRAITAAILLAACGLGFACAKSLASLAPFPCADDYTCPEGFACGTMPDASTPQCQMVCDAGTTGCNGECIDVMGDDTQNCGSCGNACAEGAVCCHGQCSTLTEPNHCGSCDHVCDSAKSCVDKKCECLPSQIVCNGNCADLEKDRHNCGQCGHDCGNGYCLSGTCHSCKAYEMACDDGCHTNNDPNNCGTCGSSCGGQPCTGGVCGSQMCAGQSWTCPAEDVYYCGSITGGCCPSTHPYFCDYQPAPCWSQPNLDCSTIVDCGGGNYHACPAGKTYDCTLQGCK